MIVRIEDPSDDRVADYVRLTDPDLRRLREQGHGEGGFFIAEGALVIRTLLTDSPYGRAVRSVLVTPLRFEALADALATLDDDVPVFVADQSVVNEVSGFPLHRGALASVHRPLLPSVEALCSAASLVVMTEGINDHENVGALFRNSAAFGVDAVVLDPTSCDPLYRRSVRVSMGHVLRVPFARPAIDSVAGVQLLQALGFVMLALTPSSDADDVQSLRGAGGRRGLVVGAEGPGLSDGVLAACDRRVRIPMAGGVDSLNVATAAAIALHQLADGPPERVGRRRSRSR
ncbi:MAG TPA: RNA methyltransferase [Acidimicrobiales bacterium]|nr:RNA methyltransferase [Acidimicrobiales bacterium]